MRVRVLMTGASVVMELEEGRAAEMFRELSGRLLGLGGHIQENGELKPESDGVVQEPVKMTSPLGAEGYKGFLYLKCPVCGVERGFSVKKPVTEITCRECGKAFPLSGLARMYANCECGAHFRYQTNMTDAMFDMPCLNCGNPVAVSWNAKKEVYETIREERT